MNPIPTWPVIEEDEIEAAANALRSGKINYWTGTECKEFEREYAEYAGVKHALCVANGTVSLEFSLQAFGIGKGDEVIVPSRTFVGTATAVMAVGATPVFADVDAISGNMTRETVAAVLSPRTKAVIPVHMAGWPCDMDPVMELAREYKLAVIEDCAQAHGARYKNRPVGSLGHIGSFSFCQDKILTTGGEGGMLLTDDTSLFKKLWALKEHGKDFDTVFHRNHPPGFRWLHEHRGTNGRMTEMQAAIGRVALRKLDERVARRRTNACLYHGLFAGIPALKLLTPAADYYHSYYRYYFNVNPDLLSKGWDRDRIVVECVKRGIPCQSGACCEIYLEKVFANEHLAPGARLREAMVHAETALMVPVYSTLRDGHVKEVAHAFLSVLAEATS